MHHAMHKALLLALLMLCSLLPARAEDFSVAVASNFAEPMRRIAEEYGKRSGHKVLLSSGATGRFYAQIKSGAPFQVLLSADEETPARLESDGLAVPGTRFTYATGKLVLWSAKEAIIDASGEVLKRGGFDHLALANPKLAPYGAAAVATLKSLGVHDALAGRFVLGENIAQTHQFISTGNAQLGFVALSQVINESAQRKPGSMWIVPQTHYPPIRQDAVLLATGRDSAAAKGLLVYLRGPDARRVIEAWGYTAGTQAR